MMPSVKMLSKVPQSSTLKLGGGGGVHWSPVWTVSHTGDLRRPLILLQAVFIHVGEDAGTSLSEHWEAPAAAAAHR